MFCKKMSDFKSWGGQFNTLSPPIKKLGGHVPNVPPPCYAPGQNYSSQDGIDKL